MESIHSVTVGVIGLGQMGLGMAVNMVRAGFAVVGFDPRREAGEQLRRAGGRLASDNAGILADAKIVLTSLVGPVYLDVARELLVPNSREGQIFVDTSTVPAPRVRELASAFAGRGSVALDAPVTGGAAAAAAGQLRMFVGGDRATFEWCRPFLESVCKPDGVTYGGVAGQGQVLKAVQQLKNRITDAVRLEVIAFGLRAGLSPDQVRRALDLTPGVFDPYERLLAAIEAGQGEAIDVVMAEWPYYLEEARARGIPMPALEGLYRFCKHGDRVCRDGVNRMAPSVWRELSSGDGPAETN